MNEWANFLITAAGASAALAGLVIVAVSVNISQILRFPHLPSRAAATIATLILILLASMAALIPQSEKSWGLEVLGFGVLCWLLQVHAGRQMIRLSRRQQRPWYEATRGIVFGQAQTLPFIIAGALLARAHENGLYWLAAGTILIFALSMFNAWVLLVEILR